MSKYCINCGKKLKENKNSESGSSLTCSKCNTLNDDQVIEQMEIHDKNQKLHNNITAANDLKDNSLCYIVIGGILLIIGILFFILSFKKTPTGGRLFRPDSFEFVISVIILACSIFSLVFGLIRLTSALKKKKYFSSKLKK